MRSGKFPHFNKRQEPMSYHLFLQCLLIDEHNPPNLFLRQSTWQIILTLYSPCRIRHILVYLCFNNLWINLREMLHHWAKRSSIVTWINSGTYIQLYVIFFRGGEGRSQKLSWIYKRHWFFYPYLYCILFIYDINSRILAFNLFNEFNNISKFTDSL